MKRVKRTKSSVRAEEARLNPVVPAWRGKRHRELRVTGRGGKHGRTMAFFSAAARRLAWEDYEKVSVAMICRDARSTRYTFYKRFPSKPAFHYALVRVAFREMTRDINRAMNPETWKGATPQAVIYRVVDEVIAKTMSVPTIGVTQLAIRIAMSKPKGAEPYFEFRAAIIDRAAELLIPKLEINNPDKAIRNTIEMLLATATDAAWRHGIPLTTERKRELAGIYGNLVLSCLGLPPARRDIRGSGAVDSPEAQFPERLRENYFITKWSLQKYEKAVKASRKLEFDLGNMTNPADAEILITREEARKADKPLKRPRKHTYKML